ncbi:MULTISPECIES: YccF domain-containing protein [Proteiniphilum]|uniref:YccF domain-containing protein n=1 Tax=Proteiniphilum TaxID=294702 RepID=UPI001EEB0FAF|nr:MULTISPECIES: YccF domain-containing protein [Proteiniphilum]ULB34769.1 YccF domain-containing protein [Proteiniphilum propionicum]
MKTIGNIIWVVFGGALIAIEYIMGSLALMITIVGIPFGLQSLKLAEVALWPFGKKIVHNESSSGCLSMLMNVIWFFVGGLPIVLTHLLLGLLFYITIIGIPFGNQHFKLMRLALTPFGRAVSSTGR